MNRNVTAATNNMLKASNQMAGAQNAALVGQVGNANRLANAAAANLTKANAQLNAAAQQAANLGLKTSAKNLANAANSVRKAEIVKALKSTANAIKAMAPLNNATAA
jgi:hypothetical protein